MEGSKVLIKDLYKITLPEQDASIIIYPMDLVKMKMRFLIKRECKDFIFDKNELLELGINFLMEDKATFALGMLSDNPITVYNKSENWIFYNEAMKLRVFIPEEYAERFADVLRIMIVPTPELYGDV